MMKHSFSGGFRQQTPYFLQQTSLHYTLRYLKDSGVSEILLSTSIYPPTDAESNINICGYKQGFDHIAFCNIIIYL